MSSKKIRTILVCFLVIISFSLSLVFPKLVSADSQIENQKNNLNEKFSIQKADTSNCKDELIVELGEQPLFCVKSTEELPKSNDTKYWEEEAKILEDDAQNFSKRISNFANMKKRCQ